MQGIESLYKHWVTADSVKQFMFTPVPTGQKDSRFAPGLLEAAQFYSASLRLQIFYALLYVVVEGYKEIEGRDTVIDRLLAKSEYVDSLRRFRNATFHFQKDPISNKLLEFLVMEGSENWGRELHSAFGQFFQTHFPIKDILERNRSGI